MSCGVGRAKVTGPKLVLAGSQDAVLLYASDPELANSTAHASLAVFPDARSAAILQQSPTSAASISAWVDGTQCGAQEFSPLSKAALPPSSDVASCAAGCYAAAASPQLGGRTSRAHDGRRQMALELWLVDPASWH